MQELNRLVIGAHSSVMQSMAANTKLQSRKMTVATKTQGPTKPVLQVVTPIHTWQFTFLWDRWYWHITTHTGSSTHFLRRWVWLVSTSKHWLEEHVWRSPMIRNETPKTVHSSILIYLQGLGMTRTLANHVSSFVFQGLFSKVELYLSLSSYYWYTVDWTEASENET